MTNGIQLKKSTNHQIVNRFDCQVRHQNPARCIPMSVNYVENTRFNIILRTKQRYTPYKITTFNTASAIKSAAKSKNESLYREIAYLDIIAKEFHVHQPCYQSLTLHLYRDDKKQVETSKSIPLENETSTSYSKSSYEEVKEYVNDFIIKEKKPASMKLLHEIYGLGIGNTSYRHKLKHRLQSDFGEKICFLSQQNKTLPEIVISAEYFTADTLLHSKEQTIKHAAKILRKDIFEKFDSFSMEDWPPDPEKLNSSELEPPESVQYFVESLLKPVVIVHPMSTELSIVWLKTLFLMFSVAKFHLKSNSSWGLGFIA